MAAPATQRARHCCSLLRPSWRNAVASATAHWQAFFAAGYGPDAVVEVVANVALNVFTNYLNNVARTTVDFPHVHPRGLSCAA